MQHRKQKSEGRGKQEEPKETYHRVETYSVNGGRELISRARPKSAILIVSFETSKFSAKKREEN